MNEQIRQIAQRMKELREILEIPAEELAAQVGIGAEQYRAYEDATDEIPISTLYAVAGVLGVDPTELLTGEAPRMNSYTIVRQGRGVKVQCLPGYDFTALAFNFVGRQMDPMIVNLGATDEPPELVTHAGQEFNLVLSGTVAVRYGRQEFILRAGDSIYFDPATPHGQRAVDGDARFLTIINE